MDNQDLLNEQVYDRTRTDELIWQRAKALGISRRRLMQLLAAGTGATTVSLLPTHQVKKVAQAQTTNTIAQDESTSALVKEIRPEWFFQVENNLEMRWENMYNRGYLVPNELFFVRNNNPTPRIDPANYKLEITGDGVSNPRSFSYDEVLSMPSISVIRAVECAGNGRSFFQAAYGKEASGTQWKLGGIGVAEWTGVPMREVLSRAEVKSNAKDVMPISLDEKKIQRPIPIEKALAEDTLLVYAMNGNILPPDHGFPIRTLVPGWVGIANIKWVGGIQVSTSPLFSLYNTEKYILIGDDYPVSEELQATGVLGEIATEQKPKSAFELPWNGEIASGNRLLRGRSWSGQGTITQVEVSFDDGQTWQQARLREPNLPQAWVRWDLDWDARPGTYKLQARATDDRGMTQPERVPFNEKGYLYWGVATHSIAVV